MLPLLLVSRLKLILGEKYSAIVELFAKNRNGSFRINRIKSDENDVLKEFSEKNILVQKFFEMDGVYMFDREYEYVIKGTRAFYEGKIYLQSIASMLPVLALDPISGETILDVCAAPGSKTTQMAMIMENIGQIYAIEQNQIRYDKLIHNCNLQGANIIKGIKMDARRFFSEKNNIFGGLFDRILLDAPCSAEGRIMLDNENTYGFWSIDNIFKKAQLQRELLEAAFDRLKVGGTLVYSTCTLAPEENEGVVSDFLASHNNAILESIDIGLSERSWWTPGIISFGDISYPEEIQKTVRILPSYETEGFFIAKIKKL